MVGPTNESKQKNQKFPRNETKKEIHSEYVK